MPGLLVAALIEYFFVPHLRMKLKEAHSAPPQAAHADAGSDAQAARADPYDDGVRVFINTSKTIDKSTYFVVSSDSLVKFRNSWKPPARAIHDNNTPQSLINTLGFLNTNEAEEENLRHSSRASSSTSKRVRTGMCAYSSSTLMRWRRGGRRRRRRQRRQPFLRESALARLRPIHVRGPRLAAASEDATVA